MKRLFTAGAGLALVAAPLAVTTTATAHDADTAARQASKPSISVRTAKATAIARHDIVKFRGSVRPGAAGEKVVLQQRLEGKKTWAATGRARVRANGTFLLTDEPTVAGTRFYRVLKPAAGSVEKSVSTELELVVYGWEFLTSRSQGESLAVATGGVQVGTETFPHSIVSYGPDAPAFIEYTLGKKCLTLRSSYALTDDSATGGTGTVALKVDDQVVFAAGLTLAQPVEDRVTSVQGAFRIRFELASSTTPLAHAAVATPEILCTK